MTYQGFCNKSNTTAAASGTGTASDYSFCTCDLFLDKCFPFYSDL